PSSQSCSLVSHCTNSPRALRRGRHKWIASILCFRLRHSPARCISCRKASRPIPILCFRARYSLASVGPNPRYIACDKIRTALSHVSSLSRRFEGRWRSPCTTARSPTSRSLTNNRLTWRLLNCRSTAACRCVISFFCTFFSTTGRARSRGLLVLPPSQPDLVNRAFLLGTIRTFSCGADISDLTIDTMVQPLIYLSRPRYGDAVNKRDLIRKIANDASLTNMQAARALDAFLDSVQSSLIRGDRVTLVGFGTFATSQH